MTSEQPWRAAYPAGRGYDMPIEKLTVGDLVDHAVAHWPGRTYLEYAGRETSFAAFANLVGRCAAAFAARGIGPGTPVVLFLPNTPVHPLAFLALAHLGAAVVQVSALDAKRELAAKLAHCGARRVVTTDFPSLLERALWLLDEGHADEVIVGEDAAWTGAAPGPALDRRLVSLATLLEATGREAPRHPAQPEDLLLLQYTGGTSGAPKAAMLSHANITAAAQMYSAWEEVPRPHGTQTTIALLPFFHIYGLVTTELFPLLEGQTVLVRPAFSVGGVLTDIHARGATIFTGVPTMWAAILQVPDAPEHDFSRLVTIASGSAPLPAAIADGVARLTGHPLGNGWGMTETAATGTRTPIHLPFREGLIGMPLPGFEMKVVALDDPDRALPPGETGEILVRGPNVFAGYWNDPEANASAFRDGWLLTGDVGWFDADGQLTYVDRRRRLIFSGGFNVYPASVERAIEAHPDVAAAIVIGVPDALRGEVPKAFVVPAPGRTPPDLRALRRFLDDRLARHEMPAALEIRETLPRSAVGKLMPRVLEEEERARRIAE